MFSSLLSYGQDAKAKWVGEVPSIASSPEKWQNLVDHLYDEGFYYGAMAASFRMLLFFEDLKTKEKAFQYLVRMIDIGYPHSLLDSFFYGNLDITDKDHFSQSYNFYKGIVNKVKSMKKWSDDYFQRIDKDNFRKYQFYQAIALYRKGQLVESLGVLDEILKGELSDKDFTFAKKVVRTKARIHFERKEYDKSLSFYDDFLLKVNPLTPSDFVERAWNLFYLKRYDELTGTLYNLESYTARNYPSFEKYILRASVYLENCAIQNIGLLQRSFKKEFNRSINGIINGKSLGKLRKLKELAKNTHPEYKKSQNALERVFKEYRKIKTLPSKFRGLANYLYRSEIRMLQNYSKFYKEKALNKAAQELTMLYESIKFLGYSTAREKYNPLTVFLPKEEKKKSLIEVLDYESQGFIFTWRQLGNFWRDERLKYFGEVVNKCDS